MRFTWFGLGSIDTETGLPHDYRVIIPFGHKIRGLAYKGKRPDLCEIPDIHILDIPRLDQYLRTITNTLNKNGELVIIKGVLSG